MNRENSIFKNSLGMYREKIFRLIFCTLVLIIDNPVSAEEDVIVRTSVTPDEVWVGQKAVMHVDTLARDGWAQIKKMGDVSLNGAYIIRVESQGVRLNETIHGDTYTGQRYEFFIFPQIDGNITLPSFSVDVEVKAWGANPVNKITLLSTPGVEFKARTPPGAEGVRGLISTTSLTVEQKWDSDIDPAEVGDAVKRRIAFKAEDVSGMAFAPLEFRKIEGLGVYQGEPDVSDTSYRGTLSGERIEKVTYIFEQPGEFNIPGLLFFWWDIKNNELKRIELPGRAFEIKGAPAVERAQQEKSEPVWRIILSAVVFISFLVLIFRGWLRSRWTEWKKARKEKEGIYFRRMIRAVRSGDARQTVHETMRWLDKINTGQGPARLDMFLDAYGDDRAKRETENLMHCMENNDPITDIPVLEKSLKIARRQWKQSCKKEKQVEKLLPELNG